MAQKHNPCNIPQLENQCVVLLILIAAPAPQAQKRGLQTEKATDDFHYERFKKQLRRY